MMFDTSMTAASSEHAWEVDVPQDTLLATKFHIPLARSTSVHRVHLIEQLNMGMQGKLALICAPAGFGKTSVVSAWAMQAEQKASVAWVSLDDDDNDMVRFWTYLINALDRLHPGLSQRLLPLLQSHQSPPIELILTALINVLTTIAEPMVLILDDYHLITPQPIHASLCFLLDHLPPHVHLVLISRTTPSLPLARWRSRGHLSELRANALRFSVEEVTALLQAEIGLSLAPELVQALAERTAGWIAGLQLAALSLKGRADSAERAEFIRAFTGSHRYIMDYLTEEVLHCQSEEVQLFLQQTALLERLSAPLCQVVTGMDRSQALLEQIEQANLFLVPLDDERVWYRYHHLFSQVLRRKLQESQPEQIAELHRRASVWHEQQGLLTQAVNHALAACEYGQAIRLMERAWPSMLYQERSILQQWIEALPAGQLQKSPRLCITYAVLLAANFQEGKVERYLQLAETSLQEKSQDEIAGQVQQMLGEIDGIRADLACNRGELPQAIALCHQALERLPVENVSLRGSINLNLGVAHVYHGEMMAAQRALTEALEQSQAAGNLYNVLHSLYRLGWMHMMQGRTRLPFYSFQHALQLVETHPQYRRSPHVSLISILMGELLREWNELESAEQMLKQGIESCEQNGFDTAPLGAGYTILAQVKQAQGAMASSIALMQQLEQIVQLHGKKILFDARISLCQVRLWIAQDKLEAAMQWKQEYRSTRCSHGSPSPLYEIECLALAQILLAQSRARRYLPGEHPLEEALQMLEQVRPFAEAGGRMGHVVEALVLQALVFQALGDLPQATKALEEALVLAEPEGYVRTFVDEGPLMAQLLQHLVASGRAWPYITTLLKALDIPTNQQQDLHSPQSCVHAALLEPLSEREVEVLRLLMSSRSNAEIAQTLVVSRNTLKTHLQHIYSKLGVTTRMQAVSRARELHLLSAEASW